MLKLEQRFAGVILRRYSIQPFTEAYDAGYDALTQSLITQPEAPVDAHVRRGVFGTRRFLDRQKPTIGRSEAFVDHGFAEVDLADELAHMTPEMREVAGGTSEFERRKYISIANALKERIM